jgi:hypothetical protein
MTDYKREKKTKINQPEKKDRILEREDRLLIEMKLMWGNKEENRLVERKIQTG